MTNEFVRFPNEPQLSEPACESMQCKMLIKTKPYKLLNLF